MCLSFSRNNSLTGLTRAFLRAQGTIRCFWILNGLLMFNSCVGGWVGLQWLIAGCLGFWHKADKTLNPWRPVCRDVTPVYGSVDGLVLPLRHGPFLTLIRTGLSSPPNHHVISYAFLVTESIHHRTLARTVAYQLLWRFEQNLTRAVCKFTPPITPCISSCTRPSFFCTYTHIWQWLTRHCLTLTFCGCSRLSVVPALQRWHVCRLVLYLCLT
jgi:hypothetical protein